MKLKLNSIKLKFSEINFVKAEAWLGNHMLLLLANKPGKAQIVFHFLRISKVLETKRSQFNSLYLKSLSKIGNVVLIKPLSIPEPELGLVPLQKNFRLNDFQGPLQMGRLGRSTTSEFWVLIDRDLK